RHTRQVRRHRQLRARRHDRLARRAAGAARGGHSPGRGGLRLDRPEAAPPPARRGGRDPDDDRAPEADARRLRRGARPTGLHPPGVRGRGRGYRGPGHPGRGRLPRLPRRDHPLPGKIGPAAPDDIVGVNGRTTNRSVTPRGRLFRKYVIVFAGLVSGALLASGAIEIYFSYQENRAALVALQREKALGVASRIEDFIKEIERQIGWTTQPQLGVPAAAMYQRRGDDPRLVPPRAALPPI